MRPFWRRYYFTSTHDRNACGHADLDRCWYHIFALRLSGIGRQGGNRIGSRSVYWPCLRVPWQPWLEGQTIVGYGGWSVPAG
jgi:hypothetical protein